MEIIRNFFPYPGTINVVNDGDLVRVKYSQLPAGAIVEPHFREWGPNPTSGQEEQWTKDSLVYADYSDLDDNEGHGSPFYNDQEIKVPLQLVTTLGSQTLYLAAIRGNELYTSGRKIGWTSHWDMKIYFMVKKDTLGYEWDIYVADWFPVNIPSLGAMDSAVFYAGVQFNPEQPPQENPVGAAPKKGGKGNSGKK